jgi:two-component system response regulator HydG
LARILVIDDEEGIRFTFNKFLSDEGYQVVTANGSGEALSRIGEKEFDLIFVDIRLDGKTGIDILQEIRRRNLMCPVVIITGYPDIATSTDALRLGAYDYIVKPVRKLMLLRVTKMALQHKAVVFEKERYRSNLDTIFRSVKDAIITVDNELKVIEVNQAALSICGFSRSMIGRGFSSQHQHCRGKCLNALQETLKEKKPVELYRIECSHESRPGQVVTVTASPLLDRLNVFSGAVMVVRDETQLDFLERDLKKLRQFGNIHGKSEKMQKIYALIDDLSGVQTTVLVTGESGTGKELVADALHYRGDRSNMPLVKVSCAALSENLLESELFGHVKGAFTGAVNDKVGRFQRADGGTIFLDEIGDITPGIQLRLLRVLQEKVFERVGDSTPIKVDVRIVAATNKDLLEKVRKGEYREDLYYRLKVVEIMLPPLRERTQDIPLLVDHFVGKFNQQFNKNIVGVSTDVLKLFMDYPWPGNVRQLVHTLEHAFILCRQSIITVNDLPPDFKSLAVAKSYSYPAGSEEETEKIIRTLEKTRWNKARAARLLGISRKTMYRRMKKYNISSSAPEQDMKV